MPATLTEYIELLLRWPELAAHERRRVERYFAGAWCWEETPSAQALEQLGAAWSELSGRRELLAPAIGRFPHSSGLRPVRRIVASGPPWLVDWKAWLDFEPTLASEWRPYFRDEAAKFNSTESALDAAVIWARYLDGGHAAWSAFARVFKRAQRKGDHRALHVYTDHCSLDHAEREPLARALAEIYGPMEVTELLQQLRFARAG